MAVTTSQLEEIAAWCGTSRELQVEREAGRRLFFAEDDPRPTHYWEGAGDYNARMRRFLGFFTFSCTLPEGVSPGIRATKALYRFSNREETLQAVSGARYVMAIVCAVVSGQEVSLELEDERFEVRDRRWSRLLSVGDAVVAHLVPTGRRGQWLPGPGWLQWPVGIGPNMRQNLKQWQVDPLSIERLLQMREEPDDERRRLPPQDDTLDEAVARMTAAAEEASLPQLVMSAREWEAWVVSHLTNPNTMAFTQEFLDRLGPVEKDDLSHWLGLLMNIWNTTPQPDRGGKSAVQMTPNLSPLGPR
jgi:hypothetical protein